VAAHKLCRTIDREALTDDERAMAGDILRVMAADAAELVRRALAGNLKAPDVGPPEVGPERAPGRRIAIGASPRGGIGLDRVARAVAWLRGQDFVSPDNVLAEVHPVLRHRLQLSYDAVADGVTADQVLDRLLDKVAIPA